MRKQIATALLVGAGFVSDVHADRAHRLQQRSIIAPAPAARRLAPLLARRAHFDHMKCAGKLKRHELASFSLDDGRLYAEWSAPLEIPLPMRVETEELDAEWMALAPAASGDWGGEPAWLLARRDLQPQRDGRFWFVRLYASHGDPGRIDIIATSEYAVPSRREAITITFSQYASMVCLQSAPVHRLALDLRAPDLRHLVHNFPEETGTYLLPALRRMSSLGETALG